MQKDGSPDNNVAQLTLMELRKEWTKYWRVRPHRYIGRQMLIKSLEFKLREKQGRGLNLEQRQRLDGLVEQYRRNEKAFEQGPSGLKPGTRLMREYKGEKYTVLVKAEGFEFEQNIYTSISEIAYRVTGTRWNGWVFFGLKKQQKRK